LKITSNKESKSIIFDLDGTLVDSSESIIESIEKAFLMCNIQPLKPLNSNIIGPPLIEILKLLSGESDKVVLNLLAENFKQSYDILGYQKTIVFSGINKMLNELYKSGYQLYIATNKRTLPTKKIINYLGWDDLFQEIYSLDSFSPPALSKSEILAKIILIHNLSKKDVIYIGDLEDDRASAKVINIKYIMVDWGYKATEIIEDTMSISSPKELAIKLLKARKNE